MVATGLVMTTTEEMAGRRFKLAEPLAVRAGLNYLLQVRPTALMDYFAFELFDERNELLDDPTYRGKLVEFVVAIRFMHSFCLSGFKIA